MKFKEWLLGSHQKSFDLPEQEKNSTEAWLPVADIRNGVILLKDGRIAKILEVLPVLFDLKSEMEKESGLLLCQLPQNRACPSADPHCEPPGRYPLLYEAHGGL